MKEVRMANIGDPTEIIEAQPAPIRREVEEPVPVGLAGFVIPVMLPLSLVREMVRQLEGDE